MTTNLIRIVDTDITYDVGRMAGKKKELILSKKPEIKKNGENFNGYGYSDWTYYYLLSESDYNEVVNFIENKSTKEKKVLTEEETLEKWAKRLSKLANVTLEEAIEIAKEKQQYKEHHVEMMENRQLERYSKKRQTLINQMMRENPLRYIKDEEHARNILIASNRHNNSDYEYLLEEGKELVKLGEIDDCKEYARSNYTYDK